MPQPSVFKLFREQLNPPPLIRADLTGKTTIVIGANIGIGLEASKHLARMNPGRLILACRNKEKGESALAGEYSFCRLLLTPLIFIFDCFQR